MRPKIALVVDRPDWAFANTARNLTRYLSDRFEFTVVPVSDAGDQMRAMLATRGHDLVHFFWRGDLRLLGDKSFRDVVAQQFGGADLFFQRFVDGVAMSTGVYDHQFLEPEWKAAFAPSFHRAAGYYVISRRLDSIYRSITEYPDPVAVLEDGVDLTLFKPRRFERFSNNGGPLVVGWAGNSLWGDRDSDPKGLRTLIRPALEALQSQGFPVVGRFADRVNGMIPHSSMVDYYSSIDVYVCASSIEGTPMPVLESMACGIPVISTDVGVVPDAFGPEQARFILPERSIEALVEALQEIGGDASLRGRLAEENLESIRSWDWSIKARGYVDFFNRCLEQGT